MNTRRQAVLAMAMLLTARVGAETSAADARAAALQLAQLLEQRYLDPAVGRRYAAALRARAAAGAYDARAEPQALAAALTADLQAVAPDRHLRAMPSRPDRPAAGAGPDPRRRVPQALEAAQWLAPGIAFVRFNAFPGDPATLDATHRFLREHADAHTLVIDVRTHRGGGIEEMDAIFAALFAQATPLVVMQSQKAVEQAHGTPFDTSRPSLRVLDGPAHLVLREHRALPDAAPGRLRQARVWLLTSAFTASAAEHFALALKRTGRGTLVGASTAGANHFGSLEPIGAGLDAFVPVGRTYDPDTGEDWEGRGIAPDVVVPPETALRVALERAGLAPELAQRIADANPAPRPPPRGPRGEPA